MADSNRYAAKLLFQFRVIVNGESGKRRTCEERIIVFEAGSAKEALALAKRRARSSQFRYRNTDGNPVRFEFVGVLDLLKLGIECENDEVWYDIIERVLPSERKSKLVPPESWLNAIRLESQKE
jgi:hypothetical protein